MYHIHAFCFGFFEAKNEAKKSMFGGAAAKLTGSAPHTYYIFSCLKKPQEILGQFKLHFQINNGNFKWPLSKCLNTFYAFDFWWRVSRKQKWRPVRPKWSKAEKFRIVWPKNPTNSWMERRRRSKRWKGSKKPLIHPLQSLWVLQRMKQFL